MEKPPASMVLENLNIPHRVFHHEKPLNSFEQAAEERNQKPEQIVRSILFQIRAEEFVMVLVAGREQFVALVPFIRRYLGLALRLAVEKPRRKHGDGMLNLRDGNETRLFDVQFGGVTIV